tara:strand:+ start:199 stop:918 length:720 start_codon:yes stop_codon:yes gene_type:complete
MEIMRTFCYNFTMGNNSEFTGGFSSPPCFAHELELDENGYMGVDRQAALDVARFRKAKRDEFGKARRSVSEEEAASSATRIAAWLERVIDIRPALVIALYSPMPGEIDLRDWMHSATMRQARIALPVVTGRDEPLLFREWTPECKMEEGMWRIPVPAAGAELTPDIVIMPLVGFDAENYRLGSGGGFYDRTLARLTPRPITIGVGYSFAKVSSIFPQPHDIPMDIIITETGDPIRRSAD